MELYIEENRTHGAGYQVRAADGTRADVIDFHPYTLLKAVLMADKAAGLLGAGDDLRGILRIDRESVLKNSGYDALSGRMAARIRRKRLCCFTSSGRGGYNT